MNKIHYKSYGIYEILNVKNGKRYVGKGQVFNRRDTHLSLLRNGKHGNRHLQNAWNKHGLKAFKFKVVLFCEPEDIGDYEAKTVRMWKTVDRRYGYNSMEPDKTGAFRHSAESRQKISDNHDDRRGEKHHLYGRCGKDSPGYGRKHSKGTKKTLSEKNMGTNNPNYGKRGEETSRYGITTPDEVRKQIAISNGAKPFEVFKDGERVEEWLVQSQCARDLEILVGNINNCLNGRLKTYYGYTFKYI